MSAQQPAEPQAVPGAKDAPSTHSWLFLFYKWVVAQLASVTSIFATTDFVVGTASSSLGAERVATDTASIDVSLSTAGQIKWAVLPAGVDHGGLAGLADDDHTQYVLRSILTTNGDLFVRKAGVVDRLAAGTDTYVLTMVSGAPAWAAPTGGSGNSFGVDIRAFAAAHG